MPDLIRKGPGNWTNYHKTVSFWASERAQLVAGSQAPARPEDYFSQTAALLKALLADAAARGEDFRPVGGHWSLCDLQKSDGAVLETSRSGQVFAVDQAMLDPACPVGANLLALAAGGTIIGDLNLWLEANGQSLKTSGASNGQSIAGAIATGTHGSVWSIGGMQNMVRGLHLIVSPGRTVWVEPAASKYLSDGFAREFADDVIRDDAMFQAAAVHLGGMGIVNAVLLEVAEAALFEVVQQKKVIGADWIVDMEEGRFRAIAARLGYDEDPYFLQVILNPFAPFRRKALIRMLFKRPYAAPLIPFLDFGRLVDPLAILARLLEEHPRLRGPMMGRLMEAAYDTIPDDDEGPLLQTWGETTPPHKSFGSLFAASIAVPRDRLNDTLAVALPAFARDDGGDHLFTLRFVGTSDGLIAFTRFGDNVVIDFDGARSDASHASYGRITKALDEAGIPFMPHWGKMGPITPARIERNFGTAASDWRAQRRLLLPPEMQTIFASAALRQWEMT